MPQANISYGFQQLKTPKAAKTKNSRTQDCALII